MLNCNDKGPVVLVEGLDLAGKSTLASFLKKRLAEHYPVVRYSRNAMTDGNDFAAFADKQRKNPDVPLSETCPLFMAAHLYDALQFKSPEPNAVHLQDSSWLRTLAFNRVRDNQTFLPLLERIARVQPKFDLSLYLTASIAVRQKRVVQREGEEASENDHSDYLVYSDPDLFRRNDEMLLLTTQSYCDCVEVIDTSELSQEDVQKAAMSALRKYGIVV